MKLLITVSDLCWGGKQQYMLDVVAGLRSRGHAVTLVALRHGEMIKRSNIDGVKHIELESFGQADVLADVIRNSGSAAIVMASGRQDAAACCEALHRVGNFRGLRTLIRHSAFPLGAGLAADYAAACDLVISTSEEQRRTQFGVLPSDKVVVVPSAIDCSRFKSAARTIRARARDRAGGLPAAAELRILVLSRLEWEKGVDAAIRAFAAAELPDRRMRLVIAGEGSERARLEAQVRHLGIEAQVTFAGQVDDVPGILASTDVSVLASTVPETGPLALKEAMAAGHAVLARRIGGIPEFVNHERTGILFDTEEQLAAALNRLADDPGLMMSLGEAAQLQVMSAHRLESRMDTLASLLRRRSLEKMPVEILARYFRHSGVRLRDDPAGPFVFCSRSSALRRISDEEMLTLRRLLGADGTINPVATADSARNCLLMLDDMQGIVSDGGRQG